ncbi:MAG: hypothetical protein QNJ68_15605 [Microcoleaceae cyanobacterium MO_207.B10]|nr:hypothetical protein [Microcoleaceae cyanobacterium MO_207.B10]
MSIHKQILEKSNLSAWPSELEKDAYQKAYQVGHKSQAIASQMSIN